MSVSTENFIKTIYHIQVDDGSKAQAGLVARKLGVSNAAVTDMARKLAERKLIDYEKYRDIRLTPEGLKMATGIIRKHRLWETLLYSVLKVPLDEIHKDAEMLEHATTNELIDRIDDFLNHPEADPHGDPIPGKDGKMRGKDGNRLIDCDPGNYLIKRIQHRSNDLLIFYTSNGFALNRKLEVIQTLEDDRSMLIKIMNQKMMISEYVARNIFVEQLKTNHHGPGNE